MWLCYQTQLGSAHPTHSKANLLTPAVVKERAAFTAGAQHGAKQGARLASARKTPTPNGFQGKVFKDKGREGGFRVRDHFVDLLLIGWW